MTSVSPSESASNAVVREAGVTSSEWLQLFQKMTECMLNPPEWATSSSSAVDAYSRMVQAGFSSLGAGSGTSQLSSLESLSGIESGDSLSTSSSAATGSSRRRRGMRKRHKAYGLCYLRAIVPARRDEAAQLCGVNPSVVDFLRLPAEFVLSLAVLVNLRASCVAGQVHIDPAGEHSVLALLAGVADVFRTGAGTVGAVVMASGVKRVSGAVSIGARELAMPLRTEHMQGGGYCGRFMREGSLARSSVWGFRRLRSREASVEVTAIDGIEAFSIDAFNTYRCDENEKCYSYLDFIIFVGECTRLGRGVDLWFSPDGREVGFRRGAAVRSSFESLGVALLRGAVEHWRAAGVGDGFSCKNAGADRTVRSGFTRGRLLSVSSSGSSTSVTYRYKY